jgi:hypothetical protein
MLDYFFDNVLQIAQFDRHVVQNKYLRKQWKARALPLVSIVLEYGATGVAPI